MPVLSLHNHLEFASAYSVTSEQAAYPRQNAQKPWRPFVPWKTTSLVGNDLFFDLYAPQTIEAIAVIHTNCPSFIWYFSNDSTFATLIHAVGPVSPSFNPWNRRYSWAWNVTGMAASRYVLYRQLAAASTLDGQGTFNTGGLWAGPRYPLPRDIRWDESMITHEPHTDMALASGGVQRLKTGPPWTTIRARRLGLVTQVTPASGDELASWLELDRSIREHERLLWWAREADHSPVWVMRRANEPEWEVGPRVAEDDLILDEVLV